MGDKGRGLSDEEILETFYGLPDGCCDSTDEGYEGAEDDLEALEQSSLTNYELYRSTPRDVYSDSDIEGDIHNTNVTVNNSQRTDSDSDTPLGETDSNEEWDTHVHYFEILNVNFCNTPKPIHSFDNELTS
jgi:hypothetical protein